MAANTRKPRDAASVTRSKFKVSPNVPQSVRCCCNLQVIHTESELASEVGGQGHWTLGRTWGISLRNGHGIGEPGVFTCGSLQHV